MGYTHYWRRSLSLPAKQFALASADCKKICEELPIPLGDGFGQGSPIFNKSVVIFNGHVKSGELSSLAKCDVTIPWPTPKAGGVAIAGIDDPKAGTWTVGDLLSSRCLDNGGDGSYETFMIERRKRLERWDEPDEHGLYFDCCKTAYRPYDLCVQCALIAMDHHLGGKHFTVSSDGDYEQWKEAVSACQHILGYGLLFELK